MSHGDVQAAPDLINDLSFNPEQDWVMCKVIDWVTYKVIDRRAHCFADHYVQQQLE